MEKKKLLLVAVSVGVFLIIVIGLSILIFLPKNKEPSVNSRVVSRGVPPKIADPLPPADNPEMLLAPEPEQREPATVDAVDMLRNREELQGLQPPPAAVPRTSGNNGSTLVIEVPRPSTVAVPNTSAPIQVMPTQNVNPQTVRPVEQPRAAPVTPPPTRSAAQPGTAAVLPPPAVSKPAPPPSSPAVQSSKTREDYWVQAGSFSTQVRAEDVKETLAAKGITAIIENRDVNGKNVFRVRVGPYTSQNEADYWLALIKTINGFEGSQIWQSKSER